MPVSLSLAAARVRWARRQGLIESSPSLRDPTQVVLSTGWLRTLGGVDVYLALRARLPSLRAADLDAAVSAGELCVTPAVRGCMYLVPRQHRPLCLRLAEVEWRRGADRDLKKTGVEWREVEALGEAVHAALAGGPLSPEGLRKALPEGAVRSLGEVGKKVGLSSPLPVALRWLEFAGRIERSLAGGRLDSERYLWRRVSRPLPDAAVPDSEADRHIALARIFFAHHAPASDRELADWSGLTLGQVRAAIAALPELVPVTIPGHAELAYALPDDLRAALPDHPVPVGAESSALHFLPFADNLLVIHGGLAALCDPAEHDRQVPLWGGRKGSERLGDARHASLRAIVVGGQLVGFWELSPTNGRVVHSLFKSASRASGLGAAALRQAADDTRRFLLEELGHGRSFSLDTDAALDTRAQLISELSG
ncbi:MAG TPA: crosslink repair DNA glycosylase YcaQ family protein [Pseudomonadota bacterium]|nr:crosslink repair DNA glycosylase YcaQ family protein [Pseudomonadota bacterium]